MLESTLLEELGQVGSGESGVIFREFIRGAVVSALVDVISEEVDSLCGSRYGRSGSGTAYRAGSAPGVCILEGRKEPLVRPRVRRNTGGKGSEK